MDKLSYKQKYLDYLKSEDWAIFKCWYIMNTKKPKCYCCRKKYSKYTFDFHHLSYDNIFKETLEDVVLVCRTCHTKIHKYEKDNNVSILDATIAIKKSFIKSRIKKVKVVVSSKPLKKLAGLYKTLGPSLVLQRPVETHHKPILGHLALF